MPSISRPGTIAQAAAEVGVSQNTVRRHLGEGLFVGYKVAGRRGIILDLDEVQRAMRSLPRGKSTASRNAYGDNARIVRLG
jgi:hypothetical protein